MCSSTLQTDSESSAASACTKKNLIDQYFGVEFETTYPDPINFIGVDVCATWLSLKVWMTSRCLWELCALFLLTSPVSMKCTESEDEEPIKGKESQLQLSCFINQEVKYLATGLRLVCDSDGN